MHSDLLKIGVVLVNWNSKDDTCECVDSLLDSDYPICHIVIVDNGSSDNSVAVIKQRFEGNSTITLLALPANYGFTGGNNIGLRFLKDLTCDVFWILNNDTVVEKYACRYMVTALKQDNKTVMVPKIYYYNTDPPLIWYAGAWF